MEHTPNLGCFSADYRHIGELMRALGSRFADPEARLTRAQSFAGYRDIRYTAAVLVCVRDPGTSRWLKRSEISNGVLAAIDSSAPEHRIGIVEPWSEQPQPSVGESCDVKGPVSRGRHIGQGER